MMSYRNLFSWTRPNLVSRAPTRVSWTPASSFASRNYATTSQEDALASATNRAQTTLKRFWKTVGIDTRSDGIAVTLDKRALKTPSGHILLLPENKRLVATFIANEWENQETLLKPHALPMTSVASRAIDTLRDEETRSDVQEVLLNYLDTDAICFPHDDPEPLVKLQTEHWDPLLEWVRSTFDVEIHVHRSVLFHSQPERTRQILRDVLVQMDPWEMAAMERVTYVTKSFFIALALVKCRLTVEQAALAAQVEVASQIERWGEVEDSHDVDYHDVRRQLGSAACLIINTP